MRKATNTRKEQIKPAKSSGRFVSPEQAAQAKNTVLEEHIKKLGLNVSGNAKVSG